MTWLTAGRAGVHSRMSAWGWVLTCLVPGATIAVVCAVALSGCNPTPTSTPVTHPPSGLTTLWVVDPDALSPPEQTLVLTLQGLVADNPSAIWVKEPGMNALILEDLRREGVALREASSVGDLLATFAADVEGMVLYELETDSINVATSLCGPLRAVAVDNSLRDTAEAAGLPVLADRWS